MPSPKTASHGQSSLTENKKNRSRNRLLRGALDEPGSRCFRGKSFDQTPCRHWDPHRVSPSNCPRRRDRIARPMPVKRVREIDSFAIAAYFHHLRSARERLIRLLRMRCTIGYATDAYRAGLLRIERVRYVVLQKLACSPARDVKEFVVQRQIDVGHEWRHCFKI